MEKMVVWLGERGHEVHLLCANHDRRPDLERIGALTVHRLRRLPRAVLPLQLALGLPSPLNPAWFLAARSLVLREGIEVVVVRDLHVALAVIAAGHLVGVPVVIDLAENWPSLLQQWWREEGPTLQNLLFRHPSGSRVLERLAVRRADHVIVVVDEMRDRLIRELGVDAARASIVMNTPRRWDGEPRARQGGPLSLVYVGEVHAGRGLRLALQAVRCTRARGIQVRLRIIGQGKPQQERHLRAMRDRAGLAAEVEFLGWMPHDAALRVAATSDIGLCPSPSCEHYDTTITNKMFEYMMIGLPVLCSDVRPQKRLIEETGAGLVFRAGCAEDMCRAISQFTDPALREICAVAGKKAVADRYHWGFDAEVLEGVLTSVSYRRTTAGAGDADAGRTAR